MAFSSSSSSSSSSSLLLLTLALFCLTLAASGATAEMTEERHANYYESLRGQKVIGVTPRDATHLSVLESLGAVYDFWLDPRGVNNAAGIRLPEDRVDEVVEKLSEAGMEPSIEVEDVEKLVRRQEESNEEGLEKRGVPLSSSSVVGRFARINDIYAWLDEMAAKYPDKASIFIAGKSYQGRQLKGLKIGSRDPKAKAIWFHAGIHAREWAAPAACIFIIDLLLNSQDPTVTRLVSELTWYVVPVLNPDGYEYSHTTNRMWRKTLRPQTYFCKGADPNRNWDAHFGTTGVSSSPCSDIYPGPHAFSEPEVRTTAQTIFSLKDSIKAYISFHAFSQLWLMPWGYTTKKCDDYDDLYNLAKEATDKVQATHGTHWRVGPPSHILYAASGGSFDWVKATAGVKYAYALELRPDRMDPGFLLPANEIIPASEEAWAGVKHIAEFLLR